MQMWKIGAVVAVAALGSTLAAQRAEALPSNTVITTYYSNAAKTIVCGVSTLDCDGNLEMDGVKGPYRTQQSYPCH